MSQSNVDWGGGQLPQSKEELLRRIEFAWTGLEATVAGLSEPAMKHPGPGGWSVKDNLAHVSAWEQFMLARYIYLRPAHEVLELDEGVFRSLDEDGINQVFYERNRDKSSAQVQEELSRSHRQVVEVLQSMAWEKLTAPFPGDREGRPVLEWVVGNTYDHYREHADYIGDLQTPSALGD